MKKPNQCSPAARAALSLRPGWARRSPWRRSTANHNSEAVSPRPRLHVESRCGPREADEEAVEAARGQAVSGRTGQRGGDRCAEDQQPGGDGFTGIALPQSVDDDADHDKQDRPEQHVRAEPVVLRRRLGKWAGLPESGRRRRSIPGVEAATRCHVSRRTRALLARRPAKYPVANATPVRRVRVGQALGTRRSSSAQALRHGARDTATGVNDPARIECQAERRRAMQNGQQPVSADTVDPPRNRLWDMPRQVPGCASSIAASVSGRWRCA
jgi:hypothetical protein